MLAAPLRPLDPARVYLAYSGAFGLLYALTAALNTVWFATGLDLSPLQLVAVGSVLEGTILVCEVPTGLLADLRGRRLSVLVGLVLVGAGFLLQGLVGSFAGVLLAQVVWGAGYTFTSGADTAWLTDEIGPDRVGRVLVRAQQLALAGTVVGTLAAGGLGLVDLRLPLVVSGAGCVLLAAALAVVMPERGFTPEPGAKPMRQAARSFRDGVAIARRRPVVRTFLVISVLAGASSEAIDRLLPLRVLDGFPGGYDPVVLFTAISLAGTALSLLVSLAVVRLRPATVDSLHPAGFLAGLAAVQVVGIVGLALAGSLWLALAAFWLRSAAGALAAPVQAAWLARSLDPGSRATALSLNSQADAFGQVVGGPPIGAVGSRWGVPAAFLVSAAVLAPTTVLYTRLRSGRNGPAAPRPAATPSPAG